MQRQHWSPPERSRELAENISGHPETCTISSKEAERLRGRVIFFEGFAFGRVACSAVKALGRWVVVWTSEGIL